MACKHDKMEMEDYVAETTNFDSRFNLFCFKYSSADNPQWVLF